jgi:hypothetical protein
VQDKTYSVSRKSQHVPLEMHELAHEISPGSAVLASLSRSFGASSKALEYLRLFIMTAELAEACMRRRGGQQHQTTTFLSNKSGSASTIETSISD